MQGQSGFKEKGPVSSFQLGPFSGIKFAFWKTQNKISVLSKSEKRKNIKRFSTCYWGPFLLLPLNWLHVKNFAVALIYFVGPKNNILRRPCRQLLTLLTLKSATVQGLDNLLK